MKTTFEEVSLREFQRNASSYLNKLPITLTQYEKPICVVFPVGMSRVENVSPVVEKVSTHDISAPLNSLRCRFCTNRGATLRKYQFEDGSGEAEEYFCPSCWDKYQSGKEVKSDVNQVRVQMPSEAQAKPFIGSFPKPVKKKK